METLSLTPLLLLQHRMPRPSTPHLNHLDIITPRALLRRSGDGRESVALLLLGASRGGEVVGTVRDDEVEGDTDDESEEVTFLYDEGDGVEEAREGGVGARVGEEVAVRRERGAPRSALEGL
jgi:hypothetical protein